VNGDIGDERAFRLNFQHGKIRLGVPASHVSGILLLVRCSHNLGLKRELCRVS
jgi:hypothetical protein